MVGKKELEKLAELEHEQWVYWSKGLIKELGNGEKLSKGRLKEWRSLWTAYKNLSEKEKESDRKWARKVVKVLGRRM